MKHSKPENTTVSPSLTDAFGRQISYLRLSVTDRCNLRCTYCMAEDMTFLPRQQILSHEEILQIASVFTSMGISKIRLTGGEPLLRQGIVSLAQQLGALPGLSELVMTTNGLLLPRYGDGLWDAGIRRLNISLDTLQPDRYSAVTRTGTLQQAMMGIEYAASLGFRIKLNVVVLRGVNDGEVIDLADFALSRGFDITYIEEMPLGKIDSHQRNDTQFFSELIRQQIALRYVLTPVSDTTGGPARYCAVEGQTSKIGFISPLSNNFCGDCNRVRLTAEGKLLLCLGNDHSLDLKALIRRYPGEHDQLRSAIVNAMTNKPEKHHFDPERVDIVRFMNMTGG